VSFPRKACRLSSRELGRHAEWCRRGNQADNSAREAREVWPIRAGNVLATQSLGLGNQCSGLDYEGVSGARSSWLRNSIWSK
jgi:hypothetical protein